MRTDEGGSGREGEQRGDGGGAQRWSQIRKGQGGKKERDRGTGKQKKAEDGQERDEINEGACTGEISIGERERERRTVASNRAYLFRTLEADCPLLKVEEPAEM